MMQHDDRIETHYPIEKMSEQLDYVTTLSAEIIERAKIELG